MSDIHPGAAHGELYCIGIVDILISYKVRGQCSGQPRGYGASPLLVPIVWVEL